MSNSPDVLPVGTILDGAYRLTRLIGMGGMGAVYEATHMGGGKRVAVKVMSRGMAAYPELLARFRREVKVTSELAHPHIVDVLGFGAAPTGQPYLVMEYLEGEDLQARLHREQTLRIGTAVQIVKQLASALSVAHAEGIVHRDLKPDNVFLVRVPGGAVFVKLVDFGISKALKASTTQLTMARAVFGTPEFMAPEQAAGQVDRIDHRSDQWSLACVAWQMLSGQLPFSGPDVNAILNQVMSAKPTPLGSDVAARIPPEVDKVLRRALSKRREDRFPTINAFARAFEATAGGAPAPAAERAARPGERAARPAERAARAEARAARRESPPPRRTWLWLSVTAVGLMLAAGAWLFRSQLPLPRWLAPVTPAHTARPAGGPTVVPLDSPRRGAGDDNEQRHRSGKPRQ